MLDEALQIVPVFVLVFFRLAGMMIFAPIFGSPRIPRRMKVLFTAILAAAIAPGISRPVHLPDNTWVLALGLGGEMAFGIAMGMVMSLVFIAGQWAGEMVGQQMGLNLSEVFDPQFGHQGSLIGDMYFMLATVIFLLIGGHRAMLQGVHASFQSAPLLSLSVNADMLNSIVGLVQSAAVLAIQLAAPVFVSLLVVDMALGFVGKTMPQFNVMSAGLTIRSLVGMLVLIFGMVLTSEVLRDALMESLKAFSTGWRMGALH